MINYALKCWLIAASISGFDFEIQIWDTYWTFEYKIWRGQQIIYMMLELY